MSAGEIVDLADDALTIIAALSGLFDENFNRGAGWVFYVMGRCVERGVNTCRLMRQFAGDDATEHTLGVMLDLIDSQITYRSRYLVGVATAPVRDMALLDPFNPRSVVFQVNRIDEGIATLPVLRRDGILEEPKQAYHATRRRTGDRARRDAGRLRAFSLSNSGFSLWRTQSPRAISCTEPGKPAPKKSRG